MWSAISARSRSSNRDRISAAMIYRVAGRLIDGFAVLFHVALMAAQPEVVPGWRAAASRRPHGQGDRGEFAMRKASIRREFEAIR